MIVERSRETSSGVRFADVVAAITLAADLALGRPLDHVPRSGAIAMRLAEQLALSDEERADDAREAGQGGGWAPALACGSGQVGARAQAQR
jgi:hypothetical protein